MKLRKEICLLLIFTFTFFTALSSFQPVGVYATEQGDIEVAVALGNSEIDISSFEDDLKTKLLNKYGVANDRVKVNVLDTGNVNVTNPTNWITYDHYYDTNYPINRSIPNGWDDNSGKKPYFYYKEGSIWDHTTYFTDISFNDNSLKSCYNRAKHIYPKNSDITFVGYSSPAFKDFMIFPDDNQWMKTIEFTLSEGKIDTHTLEGAGFMFNTGIENGNLSGYLLFYDYSDPYTQNYNNTTNQWEITPYIKLYKLTDVDVDKFHHEYISYSHKISALASYGTYGIQLIDKKPTQSMSSVKNIRIEASYNSFKLVEDGNIIYDTNSIDNGKFVINDAGSYGFGPLVGYTSHGCSSLTYFTFRNITMTTQKAKPFSEVIRQPEWNKNTTKYIVNIDDNKEIEFDDAQKRSEILYRMINRDVHYIGLGSDTNQSQSEKFILENNNKGVFIDRTEAAYNTYEKAITKIAEYISKNQQGINNGKPTAVIDYDTEHHTLSSASTDPENGLLTEEWKWKEVQAEVYGDPWLSGKPDPMIDFSEDKYYLVQLRVQDEGELWSDPTAEYISKDNLAVPLAQFELPNKELKVYEGQGTITPRQKSFHPAGVSIDEYKWIVYDSVDNEVKTYTNAVPTMDFSTASTDTYTIKLRVRVASNWSEPFSQKIKVINDITPPEIECGVVSSRINSDGGFIVIDNGGSGIYGYRVKKNDGEWQEWVKSDRGAVEAGNWSTYEIEAKDNANNSFVLRFTDITVVDNLAPSLMLAQTENITAYALDLTVQSNEDGKVYYIVLNDGANAPTTSQVRNGQNAFGNQEVNGSFHINAFVPTIGSVTQLTDNTSYDIYIIVEDNAGNISDTVMKVDATTIEADTIPPQITGISDESVYAENVIPTSTDTDIAAVTLINNQTVVNNYLLGDPITIEGVYQLTVEDHQGNVMTIDFIIDKTAPNAPNIVRAPDKDLYNDSYTIEINHGYDAVSGVEDTLYTVEGAVYSQWKPYTGAFEIADEGTTVIKAKTIDRAGNESNVVTKSVTLNKSINVFFTIKTTPDTDYSYSEYTVELMTDFEDDVVRDSVYSSVYYKLNNGSFRLYDGPFTVSQNGQTVIIAKVTDFFGNTSDEITKTIYVYSAEDEDGDGVPNEQDQYPTDTARIGDTDSDGTDDLIDEDDDNDGILDINDTYPKDNTRSGHDTDNDGVDDAIDNDDDGDGIQDNLDEHPANGNRVDDQDTDNDGVDDVIDQYPNDNTKSDLDTDSDGIDNAVDDDDDNDGVQDDEDKYPTDPSRSASDSDADGIDDIKDSDYLVQRAIEELEIIYADGDNSQRVTRDIGLVTEGQYGSSITWNSSNKEIISDIGSLVNPPDEDTQTTLTATIVNGDVTQTKVFNIKVLADILPPTITLLGDHKVFVDKGDLYVESGYEVSDNVDGDGMPVEIIGDLDTNVLGEYVLTYIVTDSSGNQASVTRTVVVVGETVDPEETITAEDEEKIADEEVISAVEGAKSKGKKKIKIVVDENVEIKKEVKVSISKDQVDSTKENDITLIMETQDVAIEVPMNAVDTSRMGSNSRLELVCEHVDSSQNAEMEAAIAQINENMSIYENKVYDFKMKVIEEDTEGNVIKDQEIENFTSKDDITLRIVVGTVPEGKTLLSFYYNEDIRQWEYIRGELKDVSMILKTKHLSIYSVMHLTKEEKQNELTDFISTKPNITVEEVLNIIDDPDMELGYNDSKYSKFSNKNKEYVAQDIIDQRPYSEYNDLKTEYDAVVNTKYDEITVGGAKITLNGPKEIRLYVNQIYSEQGATAVDDSGNDVTGKIIILGSVDTSIPGTYMLTYKIRDLDLIETRTIIVSTRSSSSSNSSVKQINDDKLEVTRGKDALVTEKVSDRNLEPKGKEMKMLSDVYEIKPKDDTNTINGQIKIKYEEDEVIYEEHLGIFVYDEDTESWKYLGGKVDARNNSISLDINTFGKVAVMEYNKTFDDIQDHWAQEIIETLASKQILSGDGDGNYRPEWGITRAEFATLITRTLGLGVGSVETGFEDIKQDDWFAPYISAARAAGIVKGVSDTEYDPHRIVNRQEMTAIVIRAYRNIEELSIDGDTIDTVDKFSDDSNIGEWAKKDVYIAKYLNLVKGRTEEMFVPLSETRRGEAATLIYRFLKALERI